MANAGRTMDCGGTNNFKYFFRKTMANAGRTMDCGGTNNFKYFFTLFLLYFFLKSIYILFKIDIIVTK